MSKVGSCGWALAALLLAGAGCQQAPKVDPAATGSVAVNASAAPAPSASAAPAKAWFEGSWQGTFQAELLRIELPAGGVKEWKNDDGKKASGEGKLSLEAKPDGSVSGTATGALGDLTVTGQVDGDRAALTLTSPQPEGFHGVILATQTPEGMKGTLNASSGDSLQVRQAAVTLSRAAK
ncbi:MAG TPA: hypothetical protein VHP33_26165 [Polyangiaceae bacterium]|nr:hypothetical protein [Polyangiaceae bacterium]